MNFLILTAQWKWHVSVISQRETSALSSDADAAKMQTDFVFALSFRSKCLKPEMLQHDTMSCCASEIRWRALCAAEVEDATSPVLQGITAPRQAVCKTLGFKTGRSPKTRIEFITLCYGIKLRRKKQNKTSHTKWKRNRNFREAQQGKRHCCRQAGVVECASYLHITSVSQTLMSHWGSSAERARPPPRLVSKLQTKKSGITNVRELERGCKVEILD